MKSTVTVLFALTITKFVYAISKPSGFLPLEKPEKWKQSNIVRNGNVDIFEDTKIYNFGNMYGMPQLSERYVTFCSESGEYLNLCGECVGGRTEKEETFGMDSCGICQGLERCSHTCSDSAEAIDEEQTNCTQILAMKPRVVEISSESTVVNLVGPDFKADSINCRALFSNTDLGPVETKDGDGMIEIHFRLSKQEGKIDLICNASNFEIHHNILVVNSSRLTPMSYDKKFINFGEESNLVMTVGNLYGLTDLLCFGIQNGETVYKYWTNDIQGNSLASKVYCERIWPKEQGEIEFGIAYTESGLGKAKTLKVPVASPDPKVVGLVNRDDQLVVLFDRNVEIVNDCSMIKDLSTVGKGAICESVANELRINLGEGAELRKNKNLVLTFGNGETYEAQIEPSAKVTEADAAIEGPDKICLGGNVLYRLIGPKEGAKWSLGFTGITNSSLSPGKRQRMAMLLWRSVRENQKNWAVGQQELDPQVTYVLQVTTKDDEGKEIKLSKSISLAVNSYPSVYINGQSKIDTNSEVLFEAQVICGTTDGLQFQWQLGDQILVTETGSKLLLKPGRFANNFTSVTVSVLNGTQVIAEGKLDVGFESSEPMLASYVDQIVFGTGHDIEIPINALDKDTFLEWSCTNEKGKCMTAGRNSQEVENVGILDEFALKIPKGNLPVGRYNVAIGTSNNNNKLTKQIEMVIVPGEPPGLSMVSAKMEASIDLLFRANDVLTPCQISTESLTTNNYSYIDLKDIAPIEKLEGSPTNPVSKDIAVKIPRNMLHFGTKYKIRFNADCGPQAQSYVVVSLPVKDLPKIEEFSVGPNTGKALSTIIEMSLQIKADTDSVYDFGVIHNDTKYVLAKTTKPKVSLYAFPGNMKTYAKMCQSKKLCDTFYGPDIQIDPGSINQDILRKSLNNYQDAVKSSTYDVALGTAKLILDSTRNDKNFINVSNQIHSAIKQKMDDVSKMLDKDDNLVNSASDLLQSSMKIIDINGSSGEMANIFNFRDKIMKVFRNKRAKIKQSAQLKMEARPRREAHRKKIQKRETQEEILRTYKNLLDSFTWGIHNQKNRSSALDQKKSLINNLEQYLMDMCNVYPLKSIFTGSTQVDQTVQLSATKFKHIGLRQEFKLPSGCGEPCNTTGQLVLGKSFFENIKNADGFCVGSSYLNNDYYTDVYNKTNREISKRVSGLYMNRVFKYTGNVIADMDLENATKRLTVAFRIPIWSGYDINDNVKCFTWLTGSGWVKNGCKSLKIIKINGNPAIECRCPLHGTHALFQSTRFKASDEKEPLMSTTIHPVIQTTKKNPIDLATTIQTTTRFSMDLAPMLKDSYKYTATFMIYENFNKTVGNKKTEFENKIKGQLGNTVGLQDESSLKTSNKNDNVEITIKFKEKDVHTPNIIMYLAKLLTDGELKLFGFDDKPLNIPEQNLELHLRNKKASASSTIIYAMCCGIFALVVGVIAVMLSGLFMKWRRENRALNFIQSMENNSRPKYLKLHDSSVDDTLAFSQQPPKSSGDLDSGIVLLVDQNKSASKYQGFDHITTPA